MREIVRECCVCKNCGFGYAQVKNHLCYTVNPPIYVAQYHCPMCKFDGEVKDSEVFRKTEEINVVTPNPTPEEMCLNGDNSVSLADKIEDFTYVESPELINRQSIEKIVEFLKRNKIQTLDAINKVAVEMIIDNSELIKCIELMYFCGVNDLGALQNGRITQEEFEFMQKIISKIKAGK